MILMSRPPSLAWPTSAVTTGTRHQWSRSTRALAIREKNLGADHIAVSAILNNLGAFYRERGEYTKAQTVFQRALSIREKWLEPDHLLIASVLNNLAIIARATGGDTRAEKLYKRGIQ